LYKDIAGRRAAFHFSIMRIVRSVAGMQALAAKWKRQGIRAALIPTMGCLHEGHLSLVRRGRRLAGPKGRVVVSIYVNPTQFGPQEDFARYPRDLRRDAKLCRTEGVDVIFAPNDAQMYPANNTEAGFSTYVVEERLADVMEGISRPNHFRGVATVVAKLFNIIQPQFAIFGAKDYQQGLIVQRMVRDLNFPLRVVIAPTLREKDGLAMSSRNKYLVGDLRTQAVVLWRAIQSARQAVKRSAQPLLAKRLKSTLERWINAEPAARTDYIEFFDPETLESAQEVTRGTHMALAVFIARTRLIDNGRL
jgi:pantoate--beta-alanine ligase